MSACFLFIAIWTFFAAAVLRFRLQSQPLLKEPHQLLRTTLLTISRALLQYVISMSPSCPEVPFSIDQLEELMMWWEDADWQQVSDHS